MGSFYTILTLIIAFMLMISIGNVCCFILSEVIKKYFQVVLKSGN